MLTLQQATNELEFRAKKFVKTIKRLLCKWVSVYSHVVNILVATEKKNLQKTQIYLLISMNVYKSLPFFNVNVTLENRER